MNSSSCILQIKTRSKTNVFRWRLIVQPILERMYDLIPIFSVWTSPPSLAMMIGTLYSGKHSLTWTENCSSHNSWSVLPAVSPSEFFPNWGCSLVVARETTESRASSPARLVVIPQAVGEKGWLQWLGTSFTAFKLFSPLPHPQPDMQSYHWLIHVNPRAKFSALGTLLLSFLWIMSQGV